MLLKRNNVERMAEGAQADKLKALGFEPIDSAGSKAAPETLKDPSNMNITELKALAKEKGIQGAASLNKEELQAVLKDVV